MPRIHHRFWPRFIYHFIIWPLQAALLCLLLFFIWILPVTIASSLIGQALAWIGPLTPWHRRARQQLELAFPDITDKKARQILTKMWNNLGRTIGEYLKIDQMLTKGLIRFEGTQHLEKNVGGFVIGAHLGNWEALAMLGRHLGVPVGLIYRPLNNPYISFLLKRRTRLANADIYEKGRAAAIAMMTTIRKGGFMLMLADQQLREGEFIPFFGQPAKTAISHFKIAAKTGKPIFFAQTIRLPQCRIVVKISPPHYLPKHASEAQINAEAALMNKQFEIWIRERPEQWLWPHRRWGKLSR